MKGMVHKIFIWAVAVIVVTLVASCQESSTSGPTDAKKSRLIASENLELKKELAGRDKEIARLKELHSKEIKRQEELLAKCQEEKEYWKKKSEENVEKQIAEVSTAVMELNAKLQEENENLKAQIDKLMAGLAESKQGEKPKE